MRLINTLQNRHAVVTGGAQGIGAAIARLLVALGANVTVLGRKLKTVQAAFVSARQRFGPISILINNAGQASSEPFLKTDLAMWNQMLAVTGQSITVCGGEVLP